jgi:hypothetical protein
MASIVVTQEEHKIFTKAWSDRIGRDGWKTREFTTSTVPNQQYVLDVAKDIYKDYPEILKALGL